MTRPARIYIVDDDLHILVAFKRLLEAARYDVATYNSPNKFLARHDPTIPGCVLLDIGMTELSGLETQKRLSTIGT